MLKDDILTIIQASTQPEPVDVSEWGAQVFLRPITAGEWMGVSYASDDNEGRMCHLLSLAITDADGIAIFSADELANMPASQGPVLSRLVNQIHVQNAGEVEKKP